MKKLKQKTPKRVSQKGFTIIEVMLSVAISALMLIGVIGGVYVSINQQRYSDALRDFAEYLRTVYSEVISPQTLGSGNSSGDDGQAILGKVLVFGFDENDNTVYSATIVGNATYADATTPDEPFLENLKQDNAKIALICGDNSKGQSSTLASYTPLWQSELVQAKVGSGDPGKKFQGTMIIARSLTSATVHTAFSSDKPTLNLKENCQPDKAASINFGNYMKSFNGSMDDDIRICVKLEGNAVIREVDIAKDGRNTSAVHILDEEDSKCHDE